MHSAYGFDTCPLIITFVSFIRVYHTVESHWYALQKQKACEEFIINKLLSIVFSFMIKWIKCQMFISVIIMPASCQFVAINSILFYFSIEYKGVSILCRNRARQMFLTKNFQVQTAVSEHSTLKLLRLKAQPVTIKPSHKKTIQRNFVC